MIRERNDIARERRMRVGRWIMRFVGATMAPQVGNDHPGSELAKTRGEAPFALRR